MSTHICFKKSFNWFYYYTVPNMTTSSSDMGVNSILELMVNFGNGPIVSWENCSLGAAPFLPYQVISAFVLTRLTPHIWKNTSLKTRVLLRIFPRACGPVYNGKNTWAYRRSTEINTRWLCPIGNSQGSLLQISTLTGDPEQPC